MSYDLMAFETSKAPQERAAFMKWYEQQVQWSEDHAYSDPSVLSEALQRFYSELSEQFPNMNVEDEIFEAMEEAGTDNRLTDYSLGTSVIYAAFAYSVADEAYTSMRELAIKHKVGFFDASSNEGDIIFP
ncbi:hypothetical protein M2444_003702 [Paenibacillus sp. PastF-3]|uniref:hypothetical protein n=1 Tax=Paenibacillus sp. PastF-3 TaxID=2940626 RepID=UPI002475B38A|nr:hypothetical protein [Paenibacillus sp. PastF-3]MDH6371903.1 hypothetical protein [Paenibacillus sp. PastF-3]